MDSSLPLSLLAPNRVVGVAALTREPGVRFNIRSANAAATTFTGILTRFIQRQPASAGNARVSHIETFNGIPARSAAPTKSIVVGINVLWAYFSWKFWSSAGTNGIRLKVHVGFKHNVRCKCQVPSSSIEPNEVLDAVSERPSKEPCPNLRKTWFPPSICSCWCLWSQTIFRKRTNKISWEAQSSLGFINGMCLLDTKPAMHMFI